MGKDKHKMHSKMPESDDNGGRIGRLDEQTMSYYRRVQQTLTDGFDDQENEEMDKELFLNNVFVELSREALPVSQNQTASNIVERLLHHATLTQLVGFGVALSKDWELACTDRFASHVTQTFLLRLAAGISAADPNDDSEVADHAIELVLEVYGFLQSSLALHMQNTYTSHIVRVMLELLAGSTVSERVIRSGAGRHSKGPSKNAAPSLDLKQHVKYPPLLKEMCKTIAGLNMIKDHLENHLSNPVLQTVVLVLREREPKLCQKVCHQLVDNTQMFGGVKDGEEDNDKLPELVGHSIASHFIEQLLAVASKDLLQTILDDHLGPKLLAMAVHPVGNYVLQKLIKAVHTTEQFEVIFKALQGHLEDVLGVDHPHVIVSLAEGCLKHGTSQEKLLKALLEAFHCHTPPERQIRCVQLFASLTTYDVFYKVLTKESDSSDENSDDDEEEKPEIEFPQLQRVNYHGSLLLQQLLKFGNPKMLVTSFLQMRPSELQRLACNPVGSHVIDAFMKTNTIGEKSRLQLQQKYKGQYADLALDRHGSRTLDTFFYAAPLKLKTTVAEELTKAQARVRGSNVGRIIWAKYGLDKYMRNKDQWRQLQTGQDKKRRMFDEIIGKDAPQKKKKKYDKHSSREAEDEEEEDAGNLRLQETTEDTGPKYKESWTSASKSSRGHGQGHKFNKSQGQGQTEDKRMNIVKDKDMKSLLHQLPEVGGPLKKHKSHKKKSKKKRV